MALIAVRSLGVNGDPLEGNGINDYIYDIDAVAQIISTRLKLFQGEWWEDLSYGVPMFQQILGAPNASQVNVISSILLETITDVPYVLGFSALNCVYNPNTRGISFSCIVKTQFGNISVNN